VYILLILGLSVPVFAEGVDEDAVDFMEIVRNIKDPMVSREDMGELQMLNLTYRKGTINGYTYLFGPPVDPIRVKMLGSGGGALELLAEGMYIRVRYFETQGYRIALELEQIQIDHSLDH
jgi:hypothetical protein